MLPYGIMRKIPNDIICTILVYFDDLTTILTMTRFFSIDINHVFSCLHLYMKNMEEFKMMIGFMKPDQKCKGFVFQFKPNQEETKLICDNLTDARIQGDLLDITFTWCGSQCTYISCLSKLFRTCFIHVYLKHNKGYWRPNILFNLFSKNGNKLTYTDISIYGGKCFIDQDIMDGFEMSFIDSFHVHHAVIHSYQIAYISRFVKKLHIVS